MKLGVGTREKKYGVRDQIDGSRERKKERKKEREKVKSAATK